MGGRDTKAMILILAFENQKRERKKMRIISSLLFILILSIPLQATETVIFSDDFNDGNAVGWTFHGTESATWSVSGGRLHHNTPSGYDNIAQLALMDGTTTPDQFTLEADISVVVGVSGSDFGHVGFAWGVTDLIEPFESWNTSYLRTHEDRVTNWSLLNGSSLVEEFLNTPGATNNITYHLNVDVDYLAKAMTVTMDANSITFTGTDFDKINQNTGGGIGLVSFNDHITFDNVLLSIPEPIHFSLLLAGVIGAVLYRRTA